MGFTYVFLYQCFIQCVIHNNYPVIFFRFIHLVSLTAVSTQPTPTPAQTPPSGE